VPPRSFVLHGAVVFLGRAGARIVSVVVGVCPGIGGAGLCVKQLLPGLDPVAITMSLVLSIKVGSIFLAGLVGQDNDASAADEVAGWVASGAVGTGRSGGCLRVPRGVGPSAGRTDRPGCLGIRRGAHDRGMMATRGDLRIVAVASHRQRQLSTGWRGLDRDDQ
jgi:hypothetical protein